MMRHCMKIHAKKATLLLILVLLFSCTAAAYANLEVTAFTYTAVPDADEAGSFKLYFCAALKNTGYYKATLTKLTFLVQDEVGTPYKEYSVKVSYPGLVESGAVSYAQYSVSVSNAEAAALSRCTCTLEQKEGRGTAPYALTVTESSLVTEEDRLFIYATVRNDTAAVIWNPLVQFALFDGSGDFLYSCLSENYDIGLLPENAITVKYAVPKELSALWETAPVSLEAVAFAKK